jgi:glycosyltransferase involved in cell wall biosynthesis
MKILFCVAKISSESEMTGTKDIISNEIKNLSRLNNQVHLFTSDFLIDRKMVTSIQKIGGIVTIFRTYIPLPEFFITPSILLKFREIRQFEIIHLHIYRSFQNLVVSFFAIIFNIPYVVQAEGSLLTFFQRPFLKKIFDFGYGHFMIKKAAGIIASSSREREQFISIGVPIEKIHVIPFGVNDDLLKNEPCKEKFKEKYDIQSPYILYLGRIHPIKGLDLLIEAFARLSAESSIHLVIAGPTTQYQAELERAIRTLKMMDKVHFPGPLYGTDKCSAFHDAVFFILPSRHDDFGLVASEAMAFGTPVIVTDQCGSSDIVREGAGIVCECSSTSLYLAMEQMLREECVRRAYGDRGRILIREKYTWEKITERLEMVYREIGKPKF